MPRNAKLIEALPPNLVSLSNTASAASAGAAYLRTKDSTTNFVTDQGGGSHKVLINLKIVDGAGTAARGLVTVGVLPAVATLATSAYAASVGSLVSTSNAATTPAAGGATFMVASTGILTATIELSAASVGTIVTIQYGCFQVVTTISIA